MTHVLETAVGTAIAGPTGNTPTVTRVASATMLTIAASTPTAGPIGSHRQAVNDLQEESKILAVVANSGQHRQLEQQQGGLLRPALRLAAKLPWAKGQCRADRVTLRDLWADRGERRSARLNRNSARCSLVA